MRRQPWIVIAATLWLTSGCSDDKPKNHPTASTSGGGSESTGSGGSNNGTGGSGSSEGSGALGNTGGSSGASGAAGAAALQGDYCGAAVPVVGSHLHVSGSDFRTDFDDLIHLADRGCKAAEPGGSDALFEVSLREGEQLWVAENGNLDAVLAIQTSCDPADTCVATEDEPDDPVLSYRAASDQTVYVVVQSYRATPATADYQIRIDVDPECANGVVEVREPCDDDNRDDRDGCSASCELEFDFDCDNSEGSSSACWPLEHLGLFAGGETIPPVEHPDALESGETFSVVVEFSERVVLNGLVEADVGNPDFRVYDSAYERIYLGNFISLDSNEPFSELGLEPGEYRFSVTAERALSNGFVLNVETRAGGECGDALLERAFEDCDNGGAEGCSNCTVEFGWECDRESPSTCSAIPDLGTFRAGSTLLDIDDPTPHESGYGQQWMVTFEEDVLLSGTYSATGTTQLLFALLDSDDEYVYTVVMENEAGFASEPIPAGTYRMSAEIDGDLSSDGYALTLVTEAQ